MSVLRRAFLPDAADAAPPSRYGGGAGDGGVGVAGGAGGASTNVTTALTIINFLSRCLGTMRRVVHEREDLTMRPVRPADLRYLWGRPNRDQHAAHFWTTAFAHLEGWHECFIWRRRMGPMTVGLDLVHPAEVTVRVESDGARSYHLHADPRRRYTDDDVVHIMVLTWDGVRAVPPIRAGVAAHRIARLQERWTSSFLRRGSAPSGIVTTAADMDETAIDSFYDLWEDQHGGPEGVGGVILLQGGAEFRSVSLSPVDAQLLQSRQFTREEILGLYAPGLPHHLLGWRSNTSNFGTGIEAQGVHLLQYVFEPRLDLVSDVLSAVLLPDDLVLGWDKRRYLRGDAKAHAEILSKLRLGGFISREEGRRQVDLGDANVPDDFYQPAHVVSIPVGGSPPQGLPASPSQTL